MSAILDAVTKELPDAEFLVPSTKPSFINDNYGSKFRVRGVDVMPWTGSIRLLGIPTFYALARSDCALICDGIIFGKKLFNPLFNFLITLIFVVPWARLVGCKMVCYSCGIGPFPSRISRVFARWVLNGCDLVIMREHDSKKLAEEIGVTKPIQVTGDAAFINPVSSPERGAEIARALGLDYDRPMLGINVTKYMDEWLASGERLRDKSAFLHTLAEGVKDANQKLGGAFQPVIFSTHPMDDETAESLAQLLSTKVVGNSRYLSHDIQAVMQRCELFMGMRFHSVILASAVGTPIVGLIYAPKVRGYMRLLNCEDYSLELAQITPQSLSERIVAGWNEREELRRRQQAVVDELKAGARRAATLLRERYFPQHHAQESARQAAGM